METGDACCRTRSASSSVLLAASHFGVHVGHLRIDVMSRTLALNRSPHSGHLHAASPSALTVTVSHALASFASWSHQFRTGSLGSFSRRFTLGAGFPAPWRFDVFAARLAFV